MKNSKKLSVSKPIPKPDLITGKVYNRIPITVHKNGGFQQGNDPTSMATSWTNRNYRKKRR